MKNNRKITPLLPPAATPHGLSIDEWNEKYPTSTPVIRYRGIRPLAGPERTKTRTSAWLMGGHSAMVMVEGVAGGVALESVIPEQPV